MSRSRTPKPVSDPVSLIGEDAKVEQPKSEVLVIGPDATVGDPADAPQPTVSVDDDGTIVIK